jgi:hypothetical protein
MVLKSARLPIQQVNPETIRQFLVQEHELMLIKSGSDPVPRQALLTSLGAFVGAVPGSCSALDLYRAKRAIDVSSFAALIVCLLALILCGVMKWMDRRAQPTTDDVYERIMQRTSPPA